MRRWYIYVVGLHLPVQTLRRDLDKRRGIATLLSEMVSIVGLREKLVHGASDGHPESRGAASTWDSKMAAM